MVSKTAIIGIVVAIIIVVGAVAAYYAMAPPAPAKPPAEEKPPAPTIQKITIVSGSTGGSTYASTAAIISAIGAAEYTRDLYVINQAGGGSAANLPLLIKGEADMAAGSIRDALDLWNAGNKELRAVFPIARFPGQLVVRADSDIKSWRDVNGKPISIGSPKFIANRMFREIMKILNIKPSKLVELGHRDSMELLIGREIDAYFFVGFPNPTVQEFAIRYSLKLVPPSPEELEAIKQKLPYRTTIVDTQGGKIYHGIDIKYEAPTAISIIWATTKLPQETVYKMVKAYWENQKIAGRLYIQHKTFKPEFMFNTKPIPLHAGVVQYYKEAGISVPQELIPPEYKG